MRSQTSDLETATRRRAFPSWSVEVPAAFEETFVQEGEGYWHAWDRTRSVSLTSVRLTDGDNDVPADALVSQMRPGLGPLREIDERPPGLIGCIGKGKAPKGSRAGTLISGFLAIDGCILILTITSDDLAWASSVLRSIQSHQRTFPERLRPARN
jgi:hypothetical protein